jgi:N-methylhydantoinase B
VGQPDLEVALMSERLADAVQMEVFSNRLLAIAEDMGSILIRSSFSSNIKERKDCAPRCSTPPAAWVAQADLIPIHLCAMMGGVHAILKRYGLDELAPGDAFVCNDPYLAGGSHLADISVITPIHHGGAVRFFAGNIAHHARRRRPQSRFDLGQLALDLRGGHPHPGDPHRARRRDRPRPGRDDRLQHARSRGAHPRPQRPGRHQRRGGRMLTALIDRMGWPAVDQAIEDVLAYTRRRLRNRIAALPDGEYTFVRELDDDGFGGDPVPIRCTARIRGEELELDFTGTGKEARGAVNLPESALQAPATTRQGGARSRADAQPGDDRPDQDRRDAGHDRQPAAARAVAPRARDQQPAVRRDLRRALPGAAPGAAMASCNDSTSATSISGWHPRRKTTYVYPESMGGGAGAFADRDGQDAIHVHTVNSTNLPVEALELEYRSCSTSTASSRIPAAREAPRRARHGAADPHPAGRHHRLAALGRARDSRARHLRRPPEQNVTRIRRNPAPSARRSSIRRPRGWCSRPARRSASRRSAAAATATRRAARSRRWRATCARARSRARRPSATTGAALVRARSRRGPDPRETSPIVPSAKVRVRVRGPVDDANDRVRRPAEHAQSFLVGGLSWAAGACWSLSNSRTPVRSFQTRPR